MKSIYSIMLFNLVFIASIACNNQFSKVSPQNSADKSVYPDKTPISVKGKKCEKLWYDGVSNGIRCYELQKKLVKAIDKGDIEGIKGAIQKGANVDAGYDSSFPPLQFAVLVKESKPIINLLLDNGADINDERNFGITALTTAVQYEKVEIVKLLLERKANVCQHVDEQTPFEVAKAKNNNKLVEVLTKFGGDNCSEKSL